MRSVIMLATVLLATLAAVFDENWHRQSELPVDKENYLFPKGQGEIVVSAPQTGPLPWLDVQFITTAPPIIVTQRP